MFDLPQLASCLFCKYARLGGGFSFLIYFSTLPGEMIQFDERAEGTGRPGGGDDGSFFIVNGHHVSMVCVCVYFEEIYIYTYIWISTSIYIYIDTRTVVSETVS